MPRPPMPWAWVAPYLTAKVQRQFWAKVDRDPSNPTVCWPWLGRFNQYGYGMFYVSGFQSRCVVVTRIAYYLANKSIDDAKFICHTCDNRACCNPKHLWLGSQKENLQDMWQKGRGVTWNRGLKTGPRKRAA